MSLHQLSLPETLELLLQGKDLSSSQANSLMKAWLSEELTPVQTGAFLAAFRCKGATGEELAAMSLVLRDACSLPVSYTHLTLPTICSV